MLAEEFVKTSSTLLKNGGHMTAEESVAVFRDVVEGLQRT